MEDQSYVRPETQDVFFPFRKNLREQNEYLHRAAVVFLMRGGKSPELQQAIPAVITQQLRRCNERRDALKVLSARTTRQHHT
jgi:hypothetical protein